MTRPVTHAERTASLSFPSVSGLPAPAGDAPGGDHPGLYLDEIFEEISALPRAEQEAALARRCAGHPTIEAEVRALLEVADPEPFLSGGARALHPGAVLNRYRLEKQLGAGATASVWMAFDLHLHAFTALKLLHPDGQIRGPMALDAVLREARAASGIISDHVVRVKTAGRFRDGPHFVDMELCAEHRPDAEGREVLDVGKALNEVELASVEEIVRVVAEAARGVDAAHRVGVMHRDLKPGNILLTPVSRRAKVTDFGLAADQLFPEPKVGTPATATVTVSIDNKGGRIVGTPAYMAPEQAAGHPPARACDVYALGATLYSLLAKRPPYEPSRKHAIEALDVLDQVRAGPPKPLRAVAPRVPRRLARIVAKAMARSPRRRYATAGELARDLELLNQKRPTSVDGWAPWLAVALYVQRNRELVYSVATLTLFLCGFAVAVGWLRMQSMVLRSEIAESAAHAESAHREAQVAEGARDNALREAKQAEREAAAAREASDLAKQGQTAAEARAGEAIAAQASAEAARDEAARLRDDAIAAREAAVAAETRAVEAATLADERARVAEALARAEQEKSIALEQSSAAVIANLEARVASLEGELSALVTQSDPSAATAWPLLESAVSSPIAEVTNGPAP